MQSESDISIAPGVTLPRSAVRLSFSRGSGPGGQNVNKLNTRAELWAAVGAIIGMSDEARRRLRQFAGKRLTQLDEIHVASDSHRTQEANRREIFDRLRELCLKALREPRKRRKTKPTRASRQRRLKVKQRRSLLKQSRRSTTE